MKDINVATPEQGDAEDAARKAIGLGAYLQLCKIYVLGDIRMVPALKNAAIDEMISLWALTLRLMEKESISYVYENTPVDSGHRRFIVDICTRTTMMSTTWKEECGMWKHVHKYFMEEMLNGMFEVRSRREGLLNYAG
jgi:hypothetical protein